MDKKIYKLSGSQAMMMTSQIFTLTPNDVKENNILSSYFLIPSNCNYEALEKAFWLVIKRNDALRLKIFRKGLHLYQYIKEYTSYSLPRVKLGSRQEFDAYLDTIDKYKIEMTADNLVWATLADMGSCGALVIRMHHACTDGFSMNLIFKQLEEFYDAFASGNTPQEPKKLYSVTDFFEQEKAYKISQQHKTDLAFWKHCYNNQRHYSFPAGKRAAHGDAEKETVSFSGEAYEKLCELCKNEGFSLQFLFMSLVALTVNSLTGADNFCIYSLTHGRTTFPLKQTVGCMMNTVPMFYDINGGLTVREFLKNQYMAFLEYLSHGKLSSGEQTPLSYKEAFKNNFNFLHGWMMFSSMEYGNTTAHSKYEPKRLPYKTIPYQFYCAFLEVKGERVEINLTYQTRRFKREQILKAKEELCRIVEIIAQSPDATINSIIKGEQK